jgi:hypothetical protein
MQSSLLAFVVLVFCACAPPIHVATGVQVIKAEAICSSNFPPPSRPPPGMASPSETTKQLSGIWHLCTYTGTPLGGDWLDRDTRDYQFTSDGRWQGLDRDSATGDLVTISGLGSYSGTYTYGDDNGKPITGDAAVFWVLTEGQAWFQPFFSADGKLMWMEVIDGSSQTYARVQ